MDKSKLFTISIAFYIGSVIPLVAGFYHLWVYSKGSILQGSINAYVEGDAYNYIINATQSVAYFVVALCLIVIASGCLIASAVLKDRANNT